MSATTQLTPAAVSGADELDFKRERDQATGSWTRADPAKAVIQSLSDYQYRIYLWDGDHLHQCALARHRSEYVGWCRTILEGGSEPCKGFLYNDGPCAHLCTLRKAAFLGHITIRDTPTPSPVTDGGTAIEPLAGGEDGQEFGRPEANL